MGQFGVYRRWEQTRPHWLVKRGRMVVCSSEQRRSRTGCPTVVPLVVVFARGHFRTTRARPSGDEGAAEVSLTPGLPPEPATVTETKG